MTGRAVKGLAASSHTPPQRVQFVITSSEDTVEEVKFEELATGEKIVEVC